MLCFLFLFVCFCFFFESLQPQNVLMFLFSMRHSSLLTTKTTADVIILWFSHGMKELLIGKSLHIRSKFWCLITASTKLIQFIVHVILLYVNLTGKINHRYFNFLFELPNRISLIGSYSLPSFRTKLIN